MNRGDATIDKLDQELILELHKNGRQSYVDLAKLLHVTETTVRNRVKNLLNKGIINITAIPDLEVLGYNFVGIVGLQIRLGDLQLAAEQLVKHPNICYIASVTGRYDLIIIAVTRSPKEFANFIEKTISAIPGILRTETFVNLNISKGRATGLDTEHLISNIDVFPSNRL